MENQSDSEKPSMFKNKVYYGEYSLEHWIRLMLNKQIILPEYQRSFQWDEEIVDKLIKTLNNNLFIPPITIGAFQNKIDKTVTDNLIIDGQQRLTSILLAYLGIYPNRKKFKAIANSDNYFGDEDMKQDEQNEQNHIEWTFSSLLDDLSHTHEKIKDILEKEENKELKEKYIIKSEWANIIKPLLRTRFIGFCYLVPSSHDNNNQNSNQQVYYSRIFNNINTQGKPLLAQESRKALYYFRDNLVKFFDPNFAKEINLKNKNINFHLDFVRYMSLLSQYYKYNGAINNIAKKKLKMEEYYEKFINSITEEGQDKDIEFASFEEITRGNNNSDVLIKKLETAINKLNIPKDYFSIIDMDMYFFGLIYEIMFNHKEINPDNKEDLIKEISDAITKFKDEKTNKSHKKAPAQLTHLRYRIDESIKIYEKYTK